MTVNISQPAINLREKLAELSAPAKYEHYKFWFVGDNATTEFSLPRGWKPSCVYDAGLLKKEGSADDYTISYDGFIYTVVFNVAPHNNNNVGIRGERTY